MKHLFVVEHLEEDVWKWCLLEYRHITSVVGKDNLLFCNTTDMRLAQFGKVSEKHSWEAELGKVCVLDPAAEKTLTPKDASRFDAFVFGGILGNDPPEARTGELLTPNFTNAEARNIGEKQMSTDTAVLVVKKILDGTPLEKLRFKDGIELEIDAGESVQLPYRYLVENGKPVLPEGLIEMLKEQEEF